MAIPGNADLSDEAQVALASSIGEVVAPERTDSLRASLGISTIAELLACIPCRYDEPPELYRIEALIHKEPAIVSGIVLGDEERSPALLDRGRRSAVAVTRIGDDSGILELRWLERADNLPEGLFPGTRVTVEGLAFVGTERLWHLPLGPRRTVRWMDDPDVFVDTGSGRRPAAPLPCYPGCSDEQSIELQILASVALEAVSPLPGALELADGTVADGAMLGRVLKGLHAPESVQERDDAWPHRQWAAGVLGRVAGPGGRAQVP